MSERVEIVLRLKSGKEFRFFASEYQIKRFKLDGTLSGFSFKDGVGEVPVYFEAQDVESISVVTPVEPKQTEGK